MDKKKFEPILSLKIQDLVSLIMVKKNLDFGLVLPYLYNSRLYDAISDEGTIRWHLSSAKLYEMLEDEKLTHSLHYPDFV